MLKLSLGVGIALKFAFEGLIFKKENKQNPQTVSNTAPPPKKSNQPNKTKPKNQTDEKGGFRKVRTGLCCFIQYQKNVKKWKL